MRFLRKRGLGAVCALLAVGAMLAIGVGTAAAAQPTFAVAVLPGSLTVGGSGTVQGTFTNNGAAVSGVIFTITFPFAVKVPAASGCASVPFFPKKVACLVGLVPAGGTASRAFEFSVPDNPGPLTVSGTAGWLSPSKPRIGRVTTGGSATIYEPGSVRIPLESGFSQTSGASGCVGQGGTVDGTAFGGLEGPIVTAGTNSSGLPCTPIVAGVVKPPIGNDQLVVKLPLGTTAQASLYFGDEMMPWPAGSEAYPPSGENAGKPLKENPIYPNQGPDVNVPWCSGDGSIPSPAADGDSSDACIVSIESTDTDDDADAGTIVLNLIGTAGDGSFHFG